MGNVLKYEIKKVANKRMIESIAYNAVFAYTVGATVPERTGTDEPHCFAYFSLAGKVVSFLIIGLLPLL